MKHVSLFFLLLSCTTYSMDKPKNSASGQESRPLTSLQRLRTLAYGAASCAPLATSSSSSYSNPQEFSCSFTYTTSTYITSAYTTSTMQSNDEHKSRDLPHHLDASDADLFKFLCREN